MLIRLPNNVKVICYRNKSFYILKFLNSRGVVKKKFYHQGIHMVVKENSIHLEKMFDLSKRLPSTFKTNNTLLVFRSVILQVISNMFKINKNRFVLEGIGFKVWKKKKTLKFKLGYSSPVFLNIPSGVHVSLYKQKKITISSINLHCMRVFGQKLKMLRSPDVYKRKGVRVWGELFKLKIGKKTR